jgi:hypothetical protein
MNLQLSNVVTASGAILADDGSLLLNIQVKCSCFRAKQKVLTFQVIYHEAQQRVSAEQALRLSAETALLAAQEEARSEQEAAEQAIGLLEEGEAAAQRAREEAERRIGEIQRDRDDALERERAEIDRLRTELAATRKQAEQATVRADNFAVLNDELRKQLVQAQTKERPTRQ